MNRSNAFTFAAYALFILLTIAIVLGQLEAYYAMPNEQRAAYDQCIRLGGTTQACAAGITVKP